MKRSLSTAFAVFLIFYNSLFAQDYFPLSPGNEWHSKAKVSLPGDSARIELEVNQMVAGDTEVYNGITYNLIITPRVPVDSSAIVFEGKKYQIYKMGYNTLPVDTMVVRKDAAGNIYVYDKDTKTENLEVPGKVEVGRKWITNDGRFERTIVATNKTFRSDNNTFQNCLIISTKSMSPEFAGRPMAYAYYCNRIGHVALIVGEEVRFVLLKWKVTTDP